MTDDDVKEALKFVFAKVTANLEREQYEQKEKVTLSSLIQRVDGLYEDMYELGRGDDKIIRSNEYLTHATAAAELLGLLLASARADDTQRRHGEE